MTSRDFCYWLQGFFELHGSDISLDATQAELVRAHLAMVFKHEIDPSHGSPEHVKELSDLHEGPKDEAARKRIEELEKILKHRREHPHDLKLMC